MFYAAAKLAKKWEVFPSSWGIGYVREVYKRYVGAGSATRRDPLLLVEDYTALHEVPEFKGKKAQKARLKAFRADGFIEKTGKGSLELILPPSVLETDKPAWLATLNAAKAIGALVSDGGNGRTLQTKRTFAGSAHRC